MLAAGAVVIGSGSGGGDSPLSPPLLPTLGSMEAEDSVEQADDGEVAPCKKFRGECSTTFDVSYIIHNISIKYVLMQVSMNRDISYIVHLEDVRLIRLKIVFLCD